MIKGMWGGPGDAPLLWEQPDEDPAEAARRAYESDVRHSQVARRMEGLRRYAISRAAAPQPAIADASQVPSRIAELWFDSVEDMERSFNSPSGLADLGDALVRLPALPVNVPEYMAGPNITFLEGESFAVAEPRGIDLHDGTCDGRLLVKLFGFVDPVDPAAFDQAYVGELAAPLSALPGPRAHLLQRRVPGEIRIGNIVRGRQPAAERVIELWFDDVAAIDRVFAAPEGRRFHDGVAALAGRATWVALRNQDIYFSAELRPELYGVDPY